VKDIYNLEVSKFMYKYTYSYRLHLTITLYSVQICFGVIRDKPKFDDLLYQKYVQTQV